METHDSTSGLTLAKRRVVTRPKEFQEQLAFLVAKGTKERIDAARGTTPKAEFLRWAIDRAVAEKLAREGGKDG